MSPQEAQLNLDQLKKLATELNYTIPADWLSDPLKNANKILDAFIKWDDELKLIKSDLGGLNAILKQNLQDLSKSNIELNIARKSSRDLISISTTLIQDKERILNLEEKEIEKLKTKILQSKQLLGSSIEEFKNKVASGDASQDELDAIESLVVSKVNLDDLIEGDENALLIAARILGYGSQYTFKKWDGTDYIDKTIDLSQIKDKELNPKDLKSPRVNEFEYTLPHSGNVVTFKLLTKGDKKKIDQELEGLKKLFPQATPPELSTRMKFYITSVNGDREIGTIREFVDKGLLARDSKELRNEIKRVSPDIELIYNEEGETEGTRIPINLNFFWPE